MSHFAKSDAHEHQDARAEQLLRQALKLDIAALGSQHPAVATDYHNLANLYAKEGKDAQSKALYKQALAFQEKTPGPQHEDTAATLRDYAALQKKDSSHR